MKTCAKCGYENDDKAKQCANCLIDLQWARLNLGKFQGTLEDTKRIGQASRKEGGILEDGDQITGEGALPGKQYKSL